MRSRATRQPMQSGHVLRKHLGQHFLQDAAFVDYLLQAMHLQPDDHVLEIGPGLGAMTLPLLKKVSAITVVEIDQDLILRWQQTPHVSVIAQDILKVNLDEWVKQQAMARQRIVGNLPYNISTPILFHLLTFIKSIDDQHLMLQKEVVDRMLALPDTADYGRLSVILQWRYQMQRIIEVPPEAFFPAPKVKSAIVSMTPKHLPSQEEALAPLLTEVLKVAFSQRRKMLRNTLEPWLIERGISNSQLDMRCRAQEISVNQYLEEVKQWAPLLTKSPLMKSIATNILY